MRNLLLLALGLFLSQAIYAQQKYEREYRIKAEEVPPPARQYIDSSLFRKPKWYYEERLQGHSIEAKAKLGKLLCSIEFDSLGKLEDVEIQMKWEEVPEEAQNGIYESLKARFSSFQLQKIQLQYTGSEEAMLALSKGKKTEASYTRKYEIIVKGSNDREVKLYEILFDAQGKIQAIEEIIIKNSDHLEY